MSQDRILTGTTASPARLDKALAEATDLSRERIKGLIAEGAVEIAGKRASSPSAKVEAGTPFTIALPALVRALKLQKRAARVGFDWDGDGDEDAEPASGEPEAVAATDSADGASASPAQATAD